MNRIFIFLFILISVSSCEVTQVIKKVSATKVDVVTFQSETKTVQFIPMAHVGKQEFYDGVYSLVDTLKRSGYVAFHEGTIKKPLPPYLVDIIYDRIKRSPVAKYYEGWDDKDSVASDLYKRKVRRLFGGLPNDSARYMDYFSQMGVFKNLVDQPRFHEMKTDERDLNIDVSLFDMIDEYERRFGTIELKEAEFMTSVDSTAASGDFEQLPWRNVKDIILDYRDRFLADQIQKSPHNKIVVIYGLAHLEGTFAYLQQADKSWKKKKTK